MSKAPNTAPVQLSTRLGLTVAEAAAAVGVSERHFRAMLPEIPHTHLGKRVVIHVRSFDEWLGKRTEQDFNAVDKIVAEVLNKLDADEDHRK